MGTKRRRIALSCVDCRRRKVKCDRTLPSCLRCRKSGVADKCKYVPYEGLDDESLENPNGSHKRSREDSPGSWVEEADDYARIASSGPNPMTTTVPHSQSNKRSTQADMVTRLEQKIADLESRIEDSKGSALSHHYTALPTPASTGMVEQSPCANLAHIEQILLRGKSFKTQYYGPSHYASILLNFDDLSQFVQDIMALFPSTVMDKRCSKGDFKAVRRELERQYASQSHSFDALIELLPQKSLVDAHLKKYLESFETTFRVLHVPTLLRQYEAFWQAPYETPASFIVTLLLVIAIVHCISPLEQAVFFGRSSSLREQATKWITICDAWFEEQSHKHVTLATYQIRILLFIAKRTNMVKIKRAWASSGNLLRLAMGAGLHREPDPTAGKITIFEQEMRRRLWATILELELLTAIDKGMPPAINPNDWDSRPPSNIHDEEFEEASSVLPDSRPYNDFTRTSYLCISSQSITLRLKMLAHINQVKPTLTVETAAQYDMRVRQALADIPNWRDDTLRLGSVSPRIARYLSELQLVEFIIMTYQPFATSKEPPARTFFSRAAFRDASSRVLEIYKRMESTGDITLRFIRHDAFRAGLCICHDLCNESASSSSVTFNRERAMELLEHALTIQEMKVLRTGQGFHGFWTMTSARTLAHSKLEPEKPREKFAEEGASRVLALNGKIVSLQDVSVDQLGRTQIGDSLLSETQAVLLKGDGMPSGLEPVPVPDLQFNFDTFNLADVISMDNFWDFNYV